MFHQAAFAPGGVVLVKNALLGSFIQRADGIQGSLTGRVDPAFTNSQASLFHGGTGASNMNAGAQAAVVVLPVALDLRLDISQLNPPKIAKPYRCEVLFYLRVLVLSSVGSRPIFMYNDLLSNFFLLAGYGYYFSSLLIL